jgi:putative ABC transport system ATP-binding protein
LYIAVDERLAGLVTSPRRPGASPRLRLGGIAMRQLRSRPTLALFGGEQQRVALARALAKRPTVVIADEPTAQVDSETAGGIMKLLREVAARATAVLTATHDGVAVEFADRVVTMEDGRLT